MVVREQYRHELSGAPVEPLYRIPHLEIRDIRVFADKTTAAKAAGEHIIAQVLQKPDSVITYATGNTMLPVYRHIAQQVEQRMVDFSQTSARHLDEYVGIRFTHPESFAGYILNEVIRPFHVPPNRSFLINGNSLNPASEAKWYNSAMKNPPADLVILGVGPHPGAHIAFNESGTNFTDETHIALLDRVTIQRDIDRGGEGFPSAFTQGPANIFAAKDIMLVAYGQDKGQALRRALTEPISEDCVASGLRLPGVGNKVTLFIDEAAAQVITAA